MGIYLEEENTLQGGIRKGKLLCGEIISREEMLLNKKRLGGNYAEEKNNC